MTMQYSEKIQLFIGSVKGGSDIVPFTNVGLVNHMALHNLNLQNGHDYFASVKGIYVLYVQQLLKLYCQEIRKEA